MKRTLLTLFLVCFSVLNSLAQCAMCRTTVVNNVSNGDSVGFAAGLNTGILYLFFAPYVVIGAIAYFWYRSSKRNAEKKQIRSYYQR